jgi:enoyl-CoA hydratase
VSVAVLTGADGTFCSGADLTAISDGRGNSVLDVAPEEIVGSLGPMGPTRLQLSKPVIAAVEGHAVAGGLELACWADLRVAASDATFGVYCRRWGVPLVDGGTVRLPRLIGHSRALDLIMTGRGIDGVEAERIGLANRVEPGRALEAAVELATEIAALPQICLRSDRTSSYDQWSLELGAALSNETSPRSRHDRLGRDARRRHPIRTWRRPPRPACLTLPEPTPPAPERLCADSGDPVHRILAQTGNRGQLRG